MSDKANMEDMGLILALAQEMLKVIPVKHTSSPVSGVIDERGFVGALVIETMALENGTMMMIRYWDDGEFEVKPVNEVGKRYAEQVKAIWAEQRGLSDGQV